MEKYYTNLDLYKGDVVVFKDGTKKEIKKVDDHKVVFEDGQKCDLWVEENNIEGIIQANRCVESFEPSEEQIVRPEKKVIIPLANSYSDLCKKIYRGRKACFYHYTEIHNALSIVNSGFLYSRYHGQIKIKYNNANYIDSTFFATSSNRSWQLERNARFYFNPKNEVTYAFYKSFESNDTFGVLIEMLFSSIWMSKNSVIITPSNAHFLEEPYFDWKTRNIGNSYKNLENYDDSEFNFNKTFEPYNAEEKNKFLTAEILFGEKVSIDLVNRFYFKTEKEKEFFLKNLDYNKRQEIKDKCEVNKELFW